MGLPRSAAWDTDWGLLQSLGAPSGTGAGLESFAFPSLHTSASLRSVSLIYGETQKQTQDGKGNRKEKNYRVGGGRGEVAKEREMKTDRKTEKELFPLL